MPTPVTIPGYITGTWNIDPSNLDVSFSVRHLGVSKAHGRFNEIAGKIVTGETLEQSSVSARIGTGSVDTGFPSRDSYIENDDVLATDEHKEMIFVSTGIRPAGTAYSIDGDLTIRGVTRPVTLSAEIGGFAADSSGRKVAGASGSVAVKRSDFGIAKNIPTMVIGEEIEIMLDIYAILES